MTPLPRLLGYLDDRVAIRDDLGVGLAAVAAVGPHAALVARLPGGTTDALGALAMRCVANATPPGAAVLVTGRVDVALATDAHGVVARRGDLPVGELRRLAGDREGFLVLAAVHSLDEAREASDAGADALIVGTIWQSASHPGHPGSGPALLEATATLGPPIFAIGGVTVERARIAREAGAWGVAAIGALWGERRVYRRALALVEAMLG